MSKKVCVYSSSSDMLDEKFYQSARLFGSRLPQHNMRLVYGGARVGIMGQMADNALENNGEVTGIIPKIISDKEIAHTGIQKLIITEDMSERKKLLIAGSDAFVAFPGGFGTLEELSEVITAKQLELHDKPIVIYNQDGFYDNLLAQFQTFYKFNFARSDYSGLYFVAQNIEEIFNYIENYKQSDITSKWYKDNLKL